jgi:hypothetical protein
MVGEEIELCEKEFLKNYLTLKTLIIVFKKSKTNKDIAEELLPIENFLMLLWCEFATKEKELIEAKVKAHALASTLGVQ